MQLCKCGFYLENTMSPQEVGLITMCLITLLSYGFSLRDSQSQYIQSGSVPKEVVDVQSEYDDSQSSKQNVDKLETKPLHVKYKTAWNNQNAIENNYSPHNFSHSTTTSAANADELNTHQQTIYGFRSLKKYSLPTKVEETLDPRDYGIRQLKLTAALSSSGEKFSTKDIKWLNSNVSEFSVSGTLPTKMPHAAKGAVQGSLGDQAKKTANDLKLPYDGELTPGNASQPIVFRRSKSLYHAEKKLDSDITTILSIDTSLTFALNVGNEEMRNISQDSLTMVTRKTSNKSSERLDISPNDEDVVNLNLEGNVTKTENDNHTEVFHGIILNNILRTILQEHQNFSVTSRLKMKNYTTVANSFPYNKETSLLNILSHDMARKNTDYEIPASKFVVSNDTNLQTSLEVSSLRPHPQSSRWDLSEKTEESSTESFDKRNSTDSPQTTPESFLNESNLSRMKSSSGQIVGERSNLSESYVENENTDEDLETTEKFSSNKSPTRQPKMSIPLRSNNKPLKIQNTYSKEYYDFNYEDRFPDLEDNPDFAMPEFQPGYLGPYHRRPILDSVVYVQPTALGPTETDLEFLNPTDVPEPNDSNGVSSTFYPFRLEDVTLQFAKKDSRTPPLSTITGPKTISSTTDKQGNHFRSTTDDDDGDYVDIRETSLTMETLAYFLIGTCCGLSILCLFIVIAAIKCRRSLVERRVRKQFRSKLYYPHNDHKAAFVWQQQFLDHMMYNNEGKHPNSSFSSKDTCHCRCVTWSLGARNLDTQPICPTRSSVYLCGRKRLPFGAASTLQYDSMIGRHRLSPIRHPKPESSNENDSLDDDSGTEPPASTCVKQCTCIRPNWQRQDIQNSLCAARIVGGQNCRDRTAETVMELKRIVHECPPPVSGMNYLDRADGVVYWSSNDERLI